MLPASDGRTWVSGPGRPGRRKGRWRMSAEMTFGVKRSMAWLGLAVLSSAAVLGCDDGDNDPTLLIVSPAAGERVELEADDMRVSIDIQVTDFKVEAPGACDGDDDV